MLLWAIILVAASSSAALLVGAALAAAVVLAPVTVMAPHVLAHNDGGVKASTRALVAAVVLRPGTAAAATAVWLVAGWAATAAPPRLALLTFLVAMSAPTAASCIVAFRQHGAIASLVGP